MNKAVIITSYTLARFIQDSLFLARKASFLVQDMQDFMHDLARKLLARSAIFL